MSQPSLAATYTATYIYQHYKYSAYKFLKNNPKLEETGVVDFDSPSDTQGINNQLTATQLVAHFTQFNLPFESSQTLGSVHNTLVAVLSNQDSTANSLIEAVNAGFHFSDEQDAS